MRHKAAIARIETLFSTPLIVLNWTPCLKRRGSFDTDTSREEPIDATPEASGEFRGP